MCEAKLIEPIAAIARDAQERLPMAVATGGRAKYIKPLLESVGILDWFGAVVTRMMWKTTSPRRIPF